MPAALLASNLLVTLAYSLLPSNFASGSGSGSTSNDQGAGAGADEEDDYTDAHLPSLGIDGDGEEARADEDYAEKALRALVTFTTRFEEDKELSAKTRLSELARRGLREVKRRMSVGEGEWDWKKLGLEQGDWTEFEGAVGRIAGQ